MELNIGTWMNVCGLLTCLLVCLVDLASSQRSTQWKEGDLRLVGGRSKNEGTVLIYHWSRWGAICDDYWDIRDANVVCSELGYAGAKEAPRRSRFGKGRRKNIFYTIFPSFVLSVCLSFLHPFFLIFFLSTCDCTVEYRYKDISIFKPLNSIKSDIFFTFSR